MKIRRLHLVASKQLSALSSALLLSVASLLPLAVTQVAHAVPGTLYWCNPTGGGSTNFNTSTNWNTNSSCSGGTQRVPATGDSLVFDSTNLSAQFAINNDISSLDIASITFSGTNASYSYDLTGNAISLDSGMTVATGNSPTVDFGITLTASQAISGGGVLSYDGDTGASGVLAVGSNTLTIGAASDGTVVALFGAMTGSGTVTVQSGAFLSLVAGDPGWTGTINVLSGGTVSPHAANSLGAASATTVINNGAILSMCGMNGATIPSNISIGGSSALQVQCQSPLGPGVTNDVTFAGAITLTANTTADVNNGTATITGPLSGAFTITLTAGASGSLVIASSNNTSNTPNTSNGKAPGTPDTGVALATSRAALTLAATSAAALALLVIARKLSYAKVRR